MIRWQDGAVVMLSWRKANAVVRWWYGGGVVVILMARWWYGDAMVVSSGDSAEHVAIW